MKESSNNITDFALATPILTLQIHGNLLSPFLVDSCVYTSVSLNTHVVMTKQLDTVQFHAVGGVCERVHAKANTTNHFDF